MSRRLCAEMAVVVDIDVALAGRLCQETAVRATLEERLQDDRGSLGRLAMCFPGLEGAPLNPRTSLGPSTASAKARHGS